MRTYDPPPYTAPHERIAAKQRAEAELDAFEAALEAKYGMPYDKLPDALKHGAPVHPRRNNPRRYDYLTTTSYHWNYRAKRDRRRPIAAIDQIGWRERRANYLLAVERVRQAEIVVRKTRAVKTGRGKKMPKNLREQAKNVVEKRELREGAW